MHPLFVAQASVLPTVVWPIPADSECGPRKFEHPELQVAFSGRGRRWLAVDGRHVEVKTSVNMVELYGAGYEIDSTRWVGSEGVCVAIQFPRLVTERLSSFRLDGFNLASSHEVFDSQVAQLCRQLVAEYRCGMPNGVMFAEGLSLALVGTLAQRYKPDTLGQGCAGLTSRQQHLIKEFIQAEIGSALRVRQLASLIDMSEPQFVRRFKASFGAPPHQYLLKRRLIAAADALRDRPEQPLAELALSLGFSSQAHFTEAFRRMHGRTPGSLRRPGLS